jgi:hypothetical protein
MLNYGLLHNKGFVTDSKSIIPNKKVDARRFITTSLENLKKVNEKFLDSMKKAMKK